MNKWNKLEGQRNCSHRRANRIKENKQTNKKPCRVKFSRVTGNKLATLEKGCLVEFSQTLFHILLRKTQIKWFYASYTFLSLNLQYFIL